MKTDLTGEDVGAFIKEVILYGKFKYYLYPIKRNTFPEGVSLSIGASTDAVRFKIVIEYQNEFLSGRYRLRIKVLLPREKCSFYKKYEEGRVLLHFAYAKNLVLIVSFLSVYKEFQNEPDERRTEILKAYKSLDLTEFIYYYLFNHATIDDSIEMRDFLDELESFLDLYFKWP